MDGKITVYALCLAMVIAASFFWNQMIALDELEGELRAHQQDEASLRADLQRHSAMLGARREVVAQLGALSVLEEGNRRQEAEIESLRESKLVVIKGFREAIAQSRANLVGREYPEMTLANGVKLQRIKIMSIDDREVIMSHDGGIIKLEPSDLPSNLLEMISHRFSVPGDARPADLEAMSRPLTNTRVSDELVRDASKRVNMAAELKVAPAPKFQPLPGGATRESLGRLFIPGRGWVDRKKVEAQPQGAR